ncbi:MAG: PPE family protein [Mycobacterium pseudokansasii]|nr:hypothetical protein A4G27_13840 [Mycobacterium kansasii]MBY0389098.1 PPE family protein [Mycobacterium pseudokansasii]
MDFAALPPEINSGRMYAGAGSGSLRAAAAAWEVLAADLYATAVDYLSVVSGLTGGPWRGSVSASMATAAAPYVSWLATTASQAQHAASQARAAAQAYEVAFQMTVPPAEVAANRTVLCSLVATNALGHNITAIATTEARYAEMWAQDAAAMYAYAAASAAASRVAPFADPPATTNEAGLTAQAAAVARAAESDAQLTTLSQLLSRLPQALQELASPMFSMDPPDWLDFIFVTAVPLILSSVSSCLGLTQSLASLSLVAGSTAQIAAADAAPLGSALAGGLGSVAGMSSAGAAMSARLGGAGSIGALSVPASWAAPPAAGTAAPSVPTSWGVAPESAAGVPGMPGVPIAGIAGQGMGGAVPRYGFRPMVVPRPPAAG